MPLDPWNFGKKVVTKVTKLAIYYVLKAIIVPAICGIFVIEALGLGRSNKEATSKTTESNYLRIKEIGGLSASSKTDYWRTSEH